jgi:TonB family protein
MMQDEGKFSRFVIFSAVLHSSAIALVLFGPGFFPAESRELWGSETGMGESIRVGVAESLPGIPLPSPEVVRETSAPTDSATLHPPEPAPPSKPAPATPVPADVLIPSKTAPATKPKPEPAPPATTGAKPKPDPVAPPSPTARGSATVDAPVPANAIPGTGGQAAAPYGQTGTGTGPASFGDEAFGRRFGTYVTGMTNAIREKWQQPDGAGIAPGKPPKVYVTFTISRDGKVANVKIEQPSGNSRLDASAHRAVLSATLPPLPREYTGSSVAVRFYFEYGR